MLVSYGFCSYKTIEQVHHARLACFSQPDGYISYMCSSCNTLPEPNKATGADAGRTLAVRDSTAPVWRETLLLYVRDVGAQKLTVHVEHAGQGTEGRNALVGVAEVTNLGALCDGGVHDLHLDLQG